MNRQIEDHRIMSELRTQIKSLGPSFDLDRVPINEREERWFKCLEPLVKKILKMPAPENSLFIRSLFDSKHPGWQSLKAIIVWAGKNLQNWREALGISARLKSPSDPDIVIMSALAELYAAKYLSVSGFEELCFNKRAIDLQAKFKGETWNIEVTYISGEDFKTQEIVCSGSQDVAPMFRLNSKKLLDKLKNKYQEEEKQLNKQYDNSEKLLIVIVTFLFETYEPWLSHEPINNTHPIEYFVKNSRIPTVVLGAGSIYEPEVPWITPPFDWYKYQN